MDLTQDDRNGFCGDTVEDRRAKSNGLTGAMAGSTGRCDSYARCGTGGVCFYPEAT